MHSEIIGVTEGVGSAHGPNQGLTRLKQSI